MLCPGAVGQSTLRAAAVDPLISAIESIKQSVASMDCLAVSPKEAKMIKRIGSAFLTSDSGDFLTAAHVIAAMQKEDDPCPTSAITVPVAGWQPEAPSEDMLWFPFKNSDCKADSVNDLAVCGLSGDLRTRIRKLHLKPVQFEWDTPPDGTRLAFTGFPLGARDPTTFRAHVAAYRGPRPNELTPELILDLQGQLGNVYGKEELLDYIVDFPWSAPPGPTRASSRLCARCRAWSGAFAQLL